MTPHTDRHYLSSDGFSRMLQAVKGDPTKVDTSTLVIVSPVASEVRALGGADSRLIEFIITSDRVDREQDTLAVDGWDFADYEKNPVVLWAHDHYCPVIGNSRSLSRTGNLIKSICEFTPQDLNPFGYMVYRLYAEKFMHAVSVGFQPLEYTYAADRKYGINYVRQGLLEYSTVPVPANPDAIAVARSKGIDTGPLRTWAEQVLDESRSGPTKLSDEARRRTEILRAVSSPTGRALILELGDMKMAGSAETTTPAPAAERPATVKMIQRWECGMAGHEHTAEADATACADFDKTLDAFVAQGIAVGVLVAAGRTLSKDQKAKIRSTLETLVPAPTPTPEPVKEGTDAASDGVFMTENGPSNDTEEEGSLEITEEMLRAAVTSAVDESMKAVTGRVD